MASAMVTNIQGYSIHDGPGIRTVVFLKGCPMRCKWCANPENLVTPMQIGFVKSLCTGCGRCRKACPHGAIRTESESRIDRDRCTGCGACVDACYYAALVRYGEEKSAGEVFDKVRRDKMFYDASGGGVTVSGGEPLVHEDFVSELFTLCRGEGISTCVETCGCVPQSAFEHVLPVTDLFYFDLKLMDSAAHQRYTGRGNEDILENARYLAGKGANILFRQPLIPGVNSGEDNIYATAAFLSGLERDDLAIQLMPYHRMGLSKYDALDKPYELNDIQIMTAGEIEAVQDLYQQLGIRCTVSR